MNYQISSQWNPPRTYKVVQTGFQSHVVKSGLSHKHARMLLNRLNTCATTGKHFCECDCLECIYPNEAQVVRQFELDLANQGEVKEMAASLKERERAILAYLQDCGSIFERETKNIAAIFQASESSIRNSLRALINAHQIRRREYRGDSGRVFYYEAIVLSGKGEDDRQAEGYSINHI